MELILAALAVVALAVVLALVGRRLRDRDAQLAEIATRLGTVPTAAGILGVVDREAAGREAIQRRADLAVRDLRLLGELIGTGILQLDDDGRVVFANAAAHALLEVDPGRLLGRTAMEAFVDARIESLVASARRGRGTSSGEVVVHTPDRATRTLVIRARRVPADGLWIVLDDVSELRALQRIRAEFIDNLSHELRTPLTTVSLLAETLAREAEAADVPARMRERIGKIEVETGHLVQMVSELLDLSRIESGGSLVLLDDVDLGRLATTSTERLRLFADRSEVALRVEVEPDLPPVRGDEDRLGQVIVNLVHNALKFSHAGGEVVVGVRRDPRREALVVSVADRGIGIPRAAQRRIFERFYKVDRARTRGGVGGTGLGLAIARHVVEQHGGRIWVESEEGTGSTFAFTVPLEAPPAAGASPAGARVDAASTPPGRATDHAEQPPAGSPA